ncbi:MAG: AgmX/PglI C-terminal domain-containing protein [Deltaproteobacteria bacterium]|nr:AgmX/PglI C-terminal domain-containing protein [Deltaproteobacteria bacterium]
MKQRDSRPSGTEVIQVFIFRDGRFYGTECFAQAKVTIGRDEDSDLQLDDEIISRAHALITISSDGMILEDLGSSNGTCVNGEAVERCFVDPRDEVSVGPFSLKLKLISPNNKARRFREETRIENRQPEQTDRTEVVLATAVDQNMLVEPEDQEFIEPTQVEPEPTELPQPDPEPEAVQAGPQLTEPEPALEHAPAEVSEDDEEEIQQDFVEPFSLLTNLIRENFAQPNIPTATTPVVEVIGYNTAKQVKHFEQVSPGKRFKIGKKLVLVHYDDRSACQLMFTDEFSGGVIRAGQTVSLDELKNSANLKSQRKGQKVYSYRLHKGDYANLVHEGGGSFLRFANPPKLPPAPKTKKFDPKALKIFGSAFVAHLLFIVVLSLTARGVNAANDSDIDRFARLDVKDIHLNHAVEEPEIPLDQLPAPDEAKDEKVPEVSQEPQDEPKQPEKKKPAKKKKHKNKKGAGGENGGGGVGMLAALGNLNQKKSSHNIVAAVSNLDAVRVPGGRSRYRVSGLVTKLPTSSVVVSRGRGVGVKSGIDVLRGGKGRGGRAGIGPGALAGGVTGRRKISGVVFKAPKRRMVVRGHLSREAIARVVKQHLRQIQYCYEKNLLLNPNLSGKVIMEWTISTAGSVSLVKTKKNTMASPSVAMCISAKIKGWKFPKPKGKGVVVVAYPFIFNSIGF